MRSTLTTILLLCSVLLFSQTNHENDSVVIAKFKKKVILHINPNPDSALYYINKSFEVVKKSNYQKGLADTEYLLAQYFKRTQQIDSALFYFENSARRSEKEGYNLGAAIAYNGLGRNLYLLARYDEAENACKKALKNVKTESDLGYMTKADTHTALGTIYARQDLDEKAQKNFLKVDSMHQLRKLRPDVIAAAYQNLGGVYLKFNELDLAESYYLKANYEFEKLPSNAAEYYKNSNNVELGKLLLKKNKLGKADSVLTISHTFFKKIKDFQTSSEISGTLARIKLEKDDLNSASELLKEAFEFHRQSEYKLEAANDAIALANLSLRMDKPKEALAWSQQAQKLNDSINNSLVEKEVAFVMAKSYSKLGQHKKAVDFNNLGYAIKDSLAQILTTERIREIEGKYQTTQRDREITLLKAQNELAKQQKISQRNLLLGAIGLITLVGIFLFVLNKNRQRTNKKLREIDALKTNFFTNISHEFRTPLTLISTPIQESLEEADLPTEKRKHFEIAERNMKRLSSLVDQLLELSKIESGHRKLMIERSNPTQLIGAWMESFLYLAKQRNMNFKTEIRNKETEAWVDRAALENVIVNLLGNAIKYTPQNGQIKVEASIKNGVLNLLVQNTGTGLTKTQMKTIFNRFYQTNTHNEGAGIGLALVKELVELHKGSIAVSSMPNKWTSFNVRLSVDKQRLPAALHHSKAAAVQHSPSVVSDFIETPTEESPNDKELPILLVVEDNADVRVLLHDLFKKEYTVILAKDGQEGITKAIEQVPDVIVSDLMMPVKDGITLTKTLKEDERTCHIPIILLTAKAGDEHELTGIHVGADDYITKPFNRSILKTKVTNLIAVRKKLQARYSQELILKPKDIAITTLDEQFLEKVQEVLDNKLAESNFSMEAFSKAVHMSRMQLHRKLKALTGLSASEFIRSQRLKLAAQILTQSDISISEVGYRVGFNDPAYFAKCFKEVYQCTPTEYTNHAFPLYKSL